MCFAIAAVATSAAAAVADVADTTTTANKWLFNTGTLEGEGI